MFEQLLLEKIDSVFKALDECLDSTVVQIKQLKDSNQLFHERIERLENKSSDKEELHSASGARGATAKTVDDYTTLSPEEPTLTNKDIQSEFAAIKDTLTKKVKLPADLRLCDHIKEFGNLIKQPTIFWHAVGVTPRLQSNCCL